MIRNSIQYKKAHEEALVWLKNNPNFWTIEEGYPHIAKNIIEFWGTQKLHEYISNLMQDTREGHRKGFCKEDADALLYLIDNHDRLYPYKEKPITTTDMWELMRFK